MISDVYVYLDNVQFEKNYFDNRNKINSLTGPIWLTIPVKDKGYLGKTINQLEIDNNQSWMKKHWKSILYNYQNTRYFNEIEGFLKEVYERKWNYLTEINEFILRYLLKQLKINTEFVKASEINLTKHKSDLIIELTHKLNGDIFVFGKFGKDYVNKEEFKKEGIEVYIQSYNHPIYPQIYDKFNPYLSIIDLISNVGLDKTKEWIMLGNETKVDVLLTK
jgi:hypothetical protein